MPSFGDITHYSNFQAGINMRSENREEHTWGAQGGFRLRLGGIQVWLEGFC